jgi:hypothetical protein
VLGTNDATLLGAVTGYQSFAAVGNGNTCYYTIADANGNWEVGLGAYSSVGPTLARTTVYASSNGGSKVSFPAGTKDVFLTYPAEKAVQLDANGDVSPLGTIASGVWQGTAVTTTYGGTGLTSYTAGDLPYYATGTTLSKLAIGTSTYLLTSTGSAPQWSNPTGLTIGTATNIAGGAASQIPYQSATGTTTFIPNGTSGQVLKSNGASAPSWVNANTLAVTSISFGATGLTPSTGTQGDVTVSGTLATANGGTGLSSFASGGAMYATSTSALATGTLPLTAGGTGQTTKVTAFNALSPITAVGDLIVGDATGSVRLPIGSSGYVLTSNGTTASWSAATSTNKFPFFNSAGVSKAISLITNSLLPFFKSNGSASNIPLVTV